MIINIDKNHPQNTNTIDNLKLNNSVTLVDIIDNLITQSAHYIDGKFAMNNNHIPS